MENAAAYNGNLVPQSSHRRWNPPQAARGAHSLPLRTLQREQEISDRQTTISPDHSPATGGEQRVSTGSSNGQTWCVASGQAGKDKLQAGLDYACGEGGADCHPIQPGSTCFDPNNLEAHASYAFNSYYQKKGRAIGTCYFGGAGYIVSQQPKYGKCEFPTGY
ncbi:O-Glycosyl hydrolase family 17 protein [Abeliophyllum distichum]|uniref:O-Glycosyl hydrolase family 17 protein n=1 Tax=Abeliophyllum distichum TaxID=126358 RepID=A0ABD1PNG4_9LAMI